MVEYVRYGDPLVFQFYDKDANSIYPLMECIDLDVRPTI